MSRSRLARLGGVLVDGPGAYVPPERRRIGYVPQEGSLFPHLTVAGNVGEANLLGGVLSGGVVTTPLGALPLDPAAASAGPAGQVTVLIRPEQIDIEPNGPGISARVTSYRYHGHHAVLSVQPDGDAETPRSWCGSPAAPIARSVRR